MVPETKNHTSEGGPVAADFEEFDVGSSRKFVEE